MANIRQSILIRTDLNLPIGLLAAQVAHLHMETVRANVNDLGQLIMGERQLKDFVEWIHDPYLFVHQVPNLEVLEYFHEEAQEQNIPNYTWEDTIYINISPLFRKAFKTTVGIVLGPCDSDRIKGVISDLPLLG